MQPCERVRGATHSFRKMAARPSLPSPCMGAPAADHCERADDGDPGRAKLALVAGEIADALCAGSWRHLRRAEAGRSAVTRWAIAHRLHPTEPTIRRRRSIWPVGRGSPETQE